LEDEFKIIVAPVHSDDAAFGKHKMVSGDDIGSLAIGDHGEVREIAIVIQQEVEFNGPLV